MNFWKKLKKDNTSIISFHIVLCCVVLYCMCMGVLHSCVSVYTYVLGCYNGYKKVQISWNWNYKRLSTPG